MRDKANNSNVLCLIIIIIAITNDIFDIKSKDGINVAGKTSKLENI